jgi:type VI secretion system Hcp family effector
MALYSYALHDQGINGSSLRKGHPKNSVIMYGFSLSLRTPFDEGQHHITSNRVWSICYADLGCDAATNLIYQACIDKDTKPASKPLKVEFGFFRVNQPDQGIDGSGDQAVYFKYNIEDARIVSVEFFMDNVSDKAGTRSEYIRVGYIFSKIAATYTKGGVGMADQWKQ